MKGVRITVLSLIITFIIISGYSIYILFDESLKLNKKITELERELAANKTKLEEKIEHESIIYEQLFRAYTLGTGGEW